MNLTTYFKHAPDTAIYPKHLGVLYLAAKLAGEIEELRAALEAGASNRPNWVKEAGDVLWYWAMIQHELGTDEFKVIEYVLLLRLDEVSYTSSTRRTITDDFVGLFSDTARILEPVAKSFRDDGGVINEDRRSEIEFRLLLIYVGLREVMDKHAVSMDEIMQANYDKLHSRKERGVLGGGGDDR